MISFKRPPGIRLWKTPTWLLTTLGVLILLAGFCVGPLRSNAAHAAPSATTFNYGEALQEAIYFYEEQSSGPKPSWNRVPWIGNSATNDGSDVGLDLSGGWYDAGDHVKFGLPMAYSVTVLDWGLIQYKNAYTQDGQYQYLLNNIKWATHYMLKAHP